MLVERHLPGLAPPYVRLEFERDASGLVRLSVYRGDARGFVTAEDLEHYDLCTEGEAADIALAVLDGAGYLPS